jgi:enoyl-[acyl-carrier protein] reductase I
VRSDWFGTVGIVIPLQSLVSVEDVGVATAFLAHDAAQLITGDTIYIDGGCHVVD